MMEQQPLGGLTLTFQSSWILMLMHDLVILFRQLGWTIINGIVYVSLPFETQLISG